MRYKVFTSDNHHGVILFAHNVSTGECVMKKFSKLGALIEYCTRENLDVTVADVQFNETAFALMSR